VYRGPGVDRGPPDVYRGPPEVYRGPCMKNMCWKSPIISTDGYGKGCSLTTEDGRWSLFIYLLL